MESFRCSGPVPLSVSFTLSVAVSMTTSLGAPLASTVVTDALMIASACATLDSMLAANITSASARATATKTSTTTMSDEVILESGVFFISSSSYLSCDSQSDTLAVSGIDDFVCPMVPYFTGWSSPSASVSRPIRLSLLSA